MYPQASANDLSVRSRWVAWITVAIVCAATVGTLSAESVLQGSAPPHSCVPSDGLRFICGPEGSEDLVQIPDTDWLIASGLNIGRPAHLFLIDSRHKGATVAFPSDPASTGRARRSASGCTGPPDPARMSMDGLGLRAGARGVHTLYAANHGDRMAIEIFEVDARGSRPRLEWRDCVPLPAGTLPNAVAPLPSTGFLVTSFYDPRDGTSWARMARGEITGRILEWHTGSGFRTLRDSELSGPNGLATSRDGRFVYTSAWSGRKIVVLSIAGGRSREIPLDFMPDNIHVLDDGSLLVGGQRGQVEQIAHCGAGACPQEWTIVRIDPRIGTVQPLLSRAGTPEVNYACGGIELGQTLYLTARGSRAVAYVSLHELPSLH